MKIDELKIIKELGNGGDGNVYLVEDFNFNKYALKIGKFNIDKNINNELIFSKKIKKYPNFFIQLKDYKIYNLGNDEKELYIKKVYSLIDGLLIDIFNHISFEAKKSLIIQLLYSFHIMIFKIGFFQTDMNNLYNIGYIKTTKKYIYLNIKGKNIKLDTYGYLIQIIDYDTISNLSENEWKDVKPIDFYTYLLPDIFYNFSEKYLKEYVEIIF